MGRFSLAMAAVAALVAVSGAGSAGNAPQAQARIAGTIGGRAIDLTRPAPSHW